MYGGTQADLIIDAIKTHCYVCRVHNNFYNWVFSEWVKVKVLDIDAASKNGHVASTASIQISGGCFIHTFAGFILSLTISGLPLQWQGEPHIAINPKPQTVQIGAKITLCCAAFGNPAPRYQWYKNGHLLLKNTTHTLQVRKDVWQVLK